MTVSASAAHGPTNDPASGQNVMTASVTVTNAFAGNPNNLPLTLSASGSVVCAGNSYSSISSVPVTRAGPFTDNGVFTVSFPQPTAGPPPALVDCSIANLTLSETDSSAVHTSTSPMLGSPPFAAGDEAFSAAFATSNGAVTGITVSFSGTSGLNTADAQLGGNVTPPSAGGGACADQEVAGNGGVVGRACVTQLQTYANQNDVVVTWNPGLLVSWQDVAGSYSEAVSVPCGAACPSFNSKEPTVTAVSPASGTSATSVTISGTNFASGASVEFEGSSRKPATSVKVVNGGTITAFPPAGLAGVANVVVTVNGLFSAITPGDRFTYTPPPTTTTTTAAALRGPGGIVLALALIDRPRGVTAATRRFTQ